MVLKRRAKRSTVGIRSADIKKDFTNRQLASIGAVTLAWNEVESSLVYAFRNALGLPNTVAMQIAKRTSIEKQIENLKRLASDKTRLPQNLEEPIKSTLGKIREYKKYRDGIVHSRSYHAEKGVGVMLDYEGASHQVLLTEEALCAFYEALVILAKEAEAMNALFGTFGQMPVIRENPDKDRAHSEQVMRDWTEKLAQAQTDRQSLQPLPEFPDLPEVFRFGE